MMVIFISNFVSPHTIPFSEELYKELGNQFLFIESGQMSAERSSLGYDKLSSKPFVVSYNQFISNRDNYQDLIDTADTVLASFGSIDTALLEKRVESNRQTFLMSERLFKKGFLKLADPKFWKTVLFVNRIKSKNFHLLCMGAYVAKDFARIGFSKEKMWKFGYITLPSPRDRQDLVAKRCTKPIKILWVGRLIWWKQPLTALKAVYKLIQDKEDVVLNVVGGGKLEGKVVDYVSKHSSQHRIHYLGLKENEMVRQMMEESHILLCTSNKLEGWGAVINEGMNAGCVVVANRMMGAAPYLLEDGVSGYLYSGGKNSLYHKLKDILQDDKLSDVAVTGYNMITQDWCPKSCAVRFINFCNNIDSGHILFPNGPLSKAL